MAVVWTIKGEAGKAVDETERTLPELQAEGAQAEFRALDSDRLTWTVWLGNVTEGAARIPDLGQKITLYRNGVRYFAGNVTGRKPRAAGGRVSVSITVEGPWWWLRNMMVSNELPDQRGEGFESERAAYVFPTGSVTDHLQGLWTRAIAMGAPISVGSIATCFDIPRLSLRNISYAECTSELMRWIPDGIVYFDYASDPEELPALCMQRRGAASTVTITPSLGIVPLIEVEPRLDLKLSQVKIASATRATVDNARITQWALQTAGVADAETPSIQLITSSGPEVDTYLPQDFTDAVVVRSKAISGNLEEIVFAKEDRIRASGVTADDFFTGGYDDGIYATPANLAQITDRDGNPLPEDYDYWLVGGEPKGWWPKDGIEYIEARLAVTIWSVHTESLPLPESPYTPPEPAWFTVVGGTLVGGYNVPSPARMRWVWYATVSVPFIAVKTLWATDTTLIRQEDYAFVNPPAGLADNLLAAQNWLPYQGQVQTVIDPGTIPEEHLLGGKMNINEVTDDLETMGALISGQTVTLRTGQIGYTLGSPSRHRYRDIVSRFRQSGADNVVWLNETSPLSGEGSGPSGFRTLDEDGGVELTEDGQATRDEG